METAPKTASEISKLPPKTLADAAYRTLRQQILDGALAAGEKLRVEHLREEMGVGATPIREALSRLSAEKLVQAEGQRGFRVAPMSLSDLLDISENRILLESRAVELSVKQGDVAWEASVVAAHHTLSRADRLVRGKEADFAAWEALNMAFHNSLVAACGSPWLLELRGLLYDQHTRYRAMSVAYVQKRGGRDVAVEHEEIVEAALGRHGKRTAQLVTDHIRATANMLSDVLANICRVERTKHGYDCGR